MTLAHAIKCVDSRSNESLTLQWILVLYTNGLLNLHHFGERIPTYDAAESNGHLILPHLTSYTVCVHFTPLYGNFMFRSLVTRRVKLTLTHWSQQSESNLNQSPLSCLLAFLRFSLSLSFTRMSYALLKYLVSWKFIELVVSLLLLLSFTFPRLQIRAFLMAHRKDIKSLT